MKSFIPKRFFFLFSGCQEHENKVVCLQAFLFFPSCSKRALSSSEASFIVFVLAGKWGEVKSKRAEPADKGNETARPHGDTGSFLLPLSPPPSTERDSAEERGNSPRARARAKRESHPLMFALVQIPAVWISLSYCFVFCWHNAHCWLALSRHKKINKKPYNKRS